MKKQENDSQNPFGLFDKMPISKQWEDIAAYIWAVCGSIIVYIFVAAKKGGWESPWLPFAIGFILIYPFKSFWRKVMSENAFRYNLIFEIVFYFVAVFALKFMWID